MLTAYVHGLGMRGAGVANWQLAATLFAEGASSCKDDPLSEPEARLLPPNERRRSSAAVRWALDVAAQATDQAGIDLHTLASVFVSSGGEYDVLDQICTGLANPNREISPTLFHHSVHNAAAGYWCIATGNQQTSTSIAAYDYSFAVGLLEAVTLTIIEQRPVLLVAYDLPPSPRLYPARPLTDAFATACVLSHRYVEPCQATLTLGLERKTFGRVATSLTDPMLEATRIGNPAARVLPLLQALVHATTDPLLFDYSDSDYLRIDLAECP
jgi:hypothetical protein